MLAIFTFVMLVAVSFLAVSLAIAFDWLLLHGVFHLMRPATALRISVRPHLQSSAGQHAGVSATLR